MQAPKKAALLWSGGKDSVLALHRALKSHDDIQVVKLVTCLSQSYDRVSMHGVRRRLVESQAEALGLLVEFVAIAAQQDQSCPIVPSGPGTTFPPNNVYTRTILESWKQLKLDGIEVIVFGDGIEVIVFGDIFLEDLRAFRDRLLLSAELEGSYPLWGRDTAELYAEFVALGYQALSVCVDTRRLGVEHCGQPLDAAFLRSLPEGVDPCGERGEYHSFVFDGPLFEHAVNFEIGQVHLREPFAFQELHPVDAAPSVGILPVLVSGAT